MLKTTGSINNPSSSVISIFASIFRAVTVRAVTLNSGTLWFFLSSSVSSLPTTPELPLSSGTGTFLSILGFSGFTLLTSAS